MKSTRRRSKSAFAAASFAVGACCAGAALADDGELTEREKRMEKRIDQLEKQVEELSKRPADGSNRAGDELSQQVEELVKDTGVGKDGLFGRWKNGIRMESSSGAFKFKIGGFLQNDWSWFWHNQNVENAFNTQVEAGTQFRRARLAVGGTIYKNIDFNAEYDFAGGTVGFRNVWMGTRLGDVGYLQVGSIKEPFGLEEQTPDLFVTFMERSSGSEAFAPAYNTGFLLSDTCMEDRITWAAGVFRDANNAGDDIGNSRSGEYNFTARVTGLPWVGEEPNEFIHVGGAVSRRTPSNKSVMFAAHPELRLAPLVVNTGPMMSNRVTLWELESAVVLGPFSATAEYYSACVDGTGSGSNGSFNAWATQASWFVTGESRAYNVKRGVFDRVIPKKNYGGDDWGALELAARLDGIDLNDGDVRGGRMTNFTLGLNWYLNPNTKVAMAWVRSHIKSLGTLNGLEARFQVDF